GARGPTEPAPPLTRELKQMSEQQLNHWLDQAVISGQVQHGLFVLDHSMQVRFVHAIETNRSITIDPLRFVAEKGVFEVPLSLVSKHDSIRALLQDLWT